MLQWELFFGTKWISFDHQHRFTDFLQDKLSLVTSGFHPGTETFSFTTDSAYLLLIRKTSMAQWPRFSADDCERYSRRAWGLLSRRGLHYSSNVWLTKKKQCALQIAVWLPYSGDFSKASERWDKWTAHQIPQLRLHTITLVQFTS